MNFKETIQSLANKIEHQKDTIKTEEGTKNAFILPLLNALGYDVFNPFEVEPEMDCDLTNHGDKVDYAIRINGEVSILLECKHWRQNLALHSTQLKKYFVASNAKFGILTNGIRYQFYTDTEKQNLMDDIPFLDINILDISQEEIDYLLKFHKDNFNTEDIINTIKKSKSQSFFKDAVLQELLQPSIGLTRFFTKHYLGISTQSVVCEYRPILQRIFQEYHAQYLDAPIAVLREEKKSAEEPFLDAFKLIKESIRGIVRGNEEILYFKTKSYYIIALNTKWWWICRLRIISKGLQIYFNRGRENYGEWITLVSANELKGFIQEIEKSYKIASQGLLNFRNRH